MRAAFAPFETAESATSFHGDHFVNGGCLTSVCENFRTCAVCVRLVLVYTRQATERICLNK